jgi:WD40 repeat protein
MPLFPAITKRPARLWALALGLVLGATSATAAPPSPTPPQLRISTLAHLGKIRGAAVDAAGRYLVTVSDDKTAKVWDLAQSQPGLTWMPYALPGDEGRLNAVAISPDGSQYVVGGWTAGGGKDYALYVVQRDSGRLLKRIGGLPDVVLSLAWSRDGRWLAVGLAGQGIRLYDAGNYALRGQDSDYAGGVYGLDFSATGQLASSAEDGQVRLYAVGAPALNRLQQRKLPQGQPIGLRFSPDGSQIAVGLDGVSGVQVLSSATLETVFSGKAADSSRLTQVAWSRDGTALYAAGRHLVNQRSAAHAWNLKRSGEVWDIPLESENLVLALLALPNGELLYTTADPLWGVADSRGTLRQLVRSDALDLRRLRPDDFLVSATGDELSVVISRQDKRQALRFGIRQGLEAGVLQGGTLARPVVAVGDTRINNWRGQTNPDLSGTALPLERYEIARSATLSADASAAFLGTDWHLRRYDRQGRSVWKTDVTEPVWALTLSGDGRLLLAAHSDGTIRWYRARDGAEQLALFVHRDGRRWVMWTPQGYYDASPGGEDLAGWQINADAASAPYYFPASRLRSHLYKPQLIADLFGPAPVAPPAPVDLAQVLPPTIQILSPLEGQRLTGNRPVIQYLAQTPGAPDGAIELQLRVNGQPVSLSERRNLVIKKAPAPRLPEARELVLPEPLPPGDHEIQLFAKNQHGTSVPARVKVVVDTPAALPAAGTTAKASADYLKPKLYVLAIGVSEYQLQHLRLGFAAKDAVDFTNALKAQKGQLYRDVEVRLLTDTQADRDSVLDGLDWIRKQVTSRDVGAVFLAGHGVNDPDGTYYYLPYNADPDRLKRTGVVFTEIKNTLSTLPGKAIFFIDTCHSGNALGTGRRAVSVDTTGAVNELASAENGVLVFSSSTGRQYSLENPAWGNGAFTKALIEGLGGQADMNRSGRITHKMLDLYISERVKELTGGMQSPVTIVPSGVPDFPIAIATKK